MSGRFRKKVKSKKSQSDDISWDCQECEAVFTDEMIKCDLCSKWLCYACQHVSQDLVKILDKYEKAGIKWYCRRCREGDGTQDSILHKVMKDTRVIEETSYRTMAIVEDLAKRFDTLIRECDTHDHLLHKVFKDNQVTDEISHKTMAMVDDLAKKFDMLINDRAAQQQLLVEVQQGVKEQTEHVKRTFAQVADQPMRANNPAPPPPDFRNIMREAIHEQKRDEVDSERRSKNIIIHGIKELVNDREKRETDATNAAFVNELLEFIDCKCEHSEYRLGRKGEGNGHQRPIKVIFNSIGDKNRVMLSLSKLRDAPEHLRLARVVDDLTQEERKLVRDKVAEARLLTLNEADSGYIHVLRGTPKNEY